MPSCNFSGNSGNSGNKNSCIYKKIEMCRSSHSGATSMKKRIVFLAILILSLGLFSRCADTKAAGKTVSAVALTAPALADALDGVYAVLIEAKAVPDHRVQATLALASLDAIATMVHAQGAALAGDEFNWASFVISAAITAARVMGYWL